MPGLDAIAERRIREAQERGEFDNLPGAGAPLDLDEDPLIPEELRVAYRLLRNAGYVPPEVEAHRELREIEQLLARTDDAGSRAGLIARVNFLLTRVGSRPAHRSLQLEQVYFERVRAKLGRARGAT